MVGMQLKGRNLMSGTSPSGASLFDGALRTRRDVQPRRSLAVKRCVKPSTT